MVTAKSLVSKVRKHQSTDTKRLETLQRFFKTGKGEYGENDRFLGVYNPELRAIVKETVGEVPLPELAQLLASPFNEERALALMFLVDYYTKAKALPARRQEVYDFYCAHTAHINNWNLVDISCYHIVGAHLLGSAEADRGVLTAWAASEVLWERRIAMVSTMAFIRAGDFSSTLQLADMLLADPQDLMHKAVGWMLREVGKRDMSVLRGFLDERAHRMPRVMLRYAIEKMDEGRRKRYLKAEAPL